MAHEVISVESWIQLALDGKANKCKKRLVKSEMPRMLANPLVTNEDELLEAVFAQPEYMNRAEREAIAEAAELLKNG